MPPVFIRLVAVGVCVASIAGFIPSAHADDATARKMIGLFGAILNEAQQQQRPRQPEAQRPNIQWEATGPEQDAVNNAERARTKQVQAALKVLGFYKGTIDGAAGRGTKAAIAAWQEKVGVTPDGILTSDQQEMLFLAATVKQDAKVEPVQSPIASEPTAEQEPAENAVELSPISSEKDTEPPLTTEAVSVHVPAPSAPEEGADPSRKKPESSEKAAKRHLTPEEKERELTFLVGYVLVSGLLFWGTVRRPLAAWYRDQMWIMAGSNPIDILFKQIGFRLMFEGFIFGLACFFGAIGGNLFVLAKLFLRARAGRGAAS